SIAGFADYLSYDSTLPLWLPAAPGSAVSLYRDRPVVATATESPSAAIFRSTSAALGDGTYSFTVTATDGAGNTGLPSSALSLTIDQSTPSAPSIAVFVKYVTNDSTQTLSLTAEPGSTVTVYRDGAVVCTATE